MTTKSRIQGHIQENSNSKQNMFVFVMDTNEFLYMESRNYHELVE